ncbi:MAG: molybdate ABC transporter substrate-binding protein [Candidatus Latescibacterota bacterium]|nr:molybdate ABC transporter substrate-binding protein [Candidatus Latescibacterota bacterium]
MFSLIGRSYLPVLAIAGLLACSPAEERASDPLLLVSAASSLSRVLQQIRVDFETTTADRVVFNFGSSGSLTQQIRHGATVDVFASASQQYLDELRHEGHLADTGLTLHGRLVVWTPPDEEPVATVDELTALRFRRIALAHTKLAPYGRAAIEALQSSHVLTQVEPRLVQAPDVLTALRYAESGSADAALTALSLVGDTDGRWYTVPADLHLKVQLGIAVATGSPRAQQARRFVDHLSTPAAVSIFEANGLFLTTAQTAL